MCILYIYCIYIYIYILHLILSAIPVRFCMSIQLQTPFRAHVNIRPTELFAMAMIKYDQGTNLGSNIWVIFKDSKSNINFGGESTIFWRYVIGRYSSPYDGLKAKKRSNQVQTSRDSAGGA